MQRLLSWRTIKLGKNRVRTTGGMNHSTHDVTQLRLRVAKLLLQKFYLSLVGSVNSEEMQKCHLFIKAVDVVRQGFLLIFEIILHSCPRNHHEPFHLGVRKRLHIKGTIMISTFYQRPCRHSHCVQSG